MIYLITLSNTLKTSFTSYIFKFHLFTTILLFLVIVIFNYNDSILDTLSEKVKNLNYLDIYKFKEDSVYKFNLKVPLDKEHNQLIYNLSPIGKFNLNEVKSAKFLKIDNYSLNNGVIEVRYSYNYFSIVLMLFGFLATVGGLIYYTKYLNKLFKNKANSINEKSKILKKYTISFMIYSTFISVILIFSMIMFDSPDFISYILNIGLDISVIIYILLMFIFIMLPPILSAKSMVIFFSSNKNKDRKELEKEIKKSPLIVGISLVLLFAPMVIIFIMIVFGIPDLIINPFKDEFYKLPMPLRVAFWITFYYFIGIAFFKITKPILKILKISKSIKDEEEIKKVKEIVDEISKKLKVKPFKKIEVLNSGVANALVEGLFREKLIITSKLLKILSEEELKAVIAHELAHKKRTHIKVGFIGFIIIGAVIYSIAIYLLKIINFESFEVFMAIFTIAYLLDYLLCKYISRKIEKDADLLAIKVVEPKTYIKALSKIHFASYMPKDGILNILMTHPSLKDRIKYIQKEFNIPEEDIKKIMNEAYKEIEELQKKVNKW